MKEKTILAYEYPSADAALEVFERAHATLKDASFYRTATPDLSRWFVLAIIGEEDARAFDWGEGERRQLTPEQETWLAMRRHGKAVDALLSGETEVSERLHYEPESAPRMPGA